MTLSKKHIHEWVGGSCRLKHSLKSAAQLSWALFVRPPPAEACRGRTAHFESILYTWMSVNKYMAKCRLRDYNLGEANTPGPKVE